MKNQGKDGSFDDIADKFQNNIYGSTKGRLRHELLLNHLERHTPILQKELVVLDAGGGTGMMTETLLKQQHRVTLTDISEDVLNLAKARLDNYQQLEVINTDILSLNQQKYDLVICHAVLEWVHNPAQVLTKLASLVNDNGYLSLSFFNRDAQLFGNMCYGNFDYVEQGMQVKNRVRLTPNYPLTPKEVLTMLQVLPLKIQHQAGIRCFHDYLRDIEKQELHYAQLKALELKYGGQEPYMWLGKYFHIIAQKVT